MIPLHKRRLITLPPARKSGRVLLRIDSAKIGLFRFLLEAYDHAALFSVLEKGHGHSPAVLKCLFSPHQRTEVLGILTDIQQSVGFSLEPWPFA